MATGTTTLAIPAATAAPEWATPAAGQIGEAPPHRRRDGGEAADVEEPAPTPSLVSVPVPEAVEHGDRPAGVGGPVDGPPGPVADPARSRLVTTRASNRSTATAPRPSQSGRYGERNGTTASSQPIGAKLSSTASHDVDGEEARPPAARCSCAGRR